MALFDAEFIKRLEYLSLVSRRVFRGQLLAQRRTKQLGSGIEFADHREYVAGDDFRYLDWNLYARHDELLLKRFQEEEDLAVYILLDCSRSMDFGANNKFDYARRIAAALAYIALADLDRVAIIGFADDVIADFPLTRGKDRILALLRFLEGLRCRGVDTDLGRAFQSFLHLGRRRGLALVVSDLYDPKGFERGLDLLRHRMFEPHVIQIYDPSEKDPDLLGDLELWDVETDVPTKVTVTERHLKNYKEVYAEFQRSVERYCLKAGVASTLASTEVSFDTLILRMMRQAGVAR